MAKSYDNCTIKNCEMCAKMEANEMAASEANGKVIPEGAKVRVTYEADYLKPGYKSHLVRSPLGYLTVPDDAEITVLSKPKPTEPEVGTVIRVPVLGGGSSRWVRLGRDKQWHFMSAYRGVSELSSTWDELHEAFPKELADFTVVTKL